MPLLADTISFASCGIDYGLLIWYYIASSLLYGFSEGLRQHKGGLTIIRYGGGPNGPMRTLGQYMLGSGATFGYGCARSRPTDMSRQYPLRKTIAADTCFATRFFMSVGSVIRTESNSPLAAEAFARARRRPLVMDRQIKRPSNRID